MKTGPSLLNPTLRVVALFALGLPLLIVSGCTAKPAQASKTTHAYPAPYVVSTAEVMQQNAVAARTRELVRAGKAPTDARRIAEKEFPPVMDSIESAESAEYYHWKQQQVAQAKFESELDKMKRKP